MKHFHVQLNLSEKFSNSKLEKLESFNCWLGNVNSVWSINCEVSVYQDDILKIFLNKIGQNSMDCKDEFFDCENWGLEPNNLTPLAGAS